MSSQPHISATPTPTPTPTPLAYEQTPMRVRAPRWVVGIVAAYLLCLLGMLTFGTYAAAQQDRPFARVMVGTFVVLLVAWGSLLLVPVRAAARRPLTRRAIWVPLLASGFFAALLLFGLVITVAEVFRANDEPSAWIAIGVGLAGWVAWAVVFGLVARGTSPDHVGSHLGRYLIAGSALELLVAVPAHVYVRRRTECCAGIATGTGICIGVAVMFLAFGPGVVMLYLKRVRQISNR